jgi:hypothetical protein
MEYGQPQPDVVSSSRTQSCMKGGRETTFGPRGSRCNVRFANGNRKGTPVRTGHAREQNTWNRLSR